MANQKDTHIPLLRPEFEGFREWGTSTPLKAPILSDKQGGGGSGERREDIVQIVIDSIRNNTWTADGANPEAAKINKRWLRNRD